MTDRACHVLFLSDLVLVSSPVVTAVTATIRLALIATALTCIGGTMAVHAQETASTPSWGDVGGGFAPFFRANLDEASCCNPPGGWVTWGTGRFRLQMDYLHNRRRYLTCAGYYGEREGQETVVQRAYLDTHVEQVASPLVYWRLSENSHASPHFLFGLAYWNFADRLCVAGSDPVVQLPPRPHDPNEWLYRVEFAEGEEQRCLDESPSRFHRIHPQIGVGADIPIGSRFFARAQARAFSAELRIGVGLRF